MGTFGRASVVVIPFPFSDLSGTKLRPAILLAEAQCNDWLCCQVTRNPLSDPDAVRLTSKSLRQGSLVAPISYIRPFKLFTVNESVIFKHVATLKDETYKEILQIIIRGLRKRLPKS